LLSSLGHPVATSPRDFEPGSPTAYISPRDFAFTAWLTGRPFSEGLRARHRQAPRPLIFLRGNLLSPLGHPVATCPRDFEPGSPTAYIFPRDFAVTARPPGCHLSEGFRARLPDRLHFSEGICCHRSATRLPLVRGISSPAPRPLTFFRGILLSSLGSPVDPLPRDFRARHRQAPRPRAFFRGILLRPLGSPVAPLPRDFEPGSPTANFFPRDFASTAWLTGRPLSEGFSSPAPRPLTGFRGILLPPLGSPVAPFPRDFEPGSPTAYRFPRDFASTAWLIGRPFSEGF